MLGFRRTRFEITADGGFFYTPCGPIGVGLALLLIARLGYQGLEVLESRGGSPGPETVALTPMTLFVFSILAVYLGTYSLGLLLWRGRVDRRRERR